MVRAVTSKTLFLSEHAIVYRWVYFLSVKILFANTKNKDSWPPNRPDTSPLEYHVWGSMLEKSSAEKHPGTEVSAYKYLGRVITGWNLQVDNWLQKASASVCKCRTWTFRALTVAFTGILLTCFIQVTWCSKNVVT